MDLPKLSGLPQDLSEEGRALAVTSSRREQNRVAQRRYRQRQKAERERKQTFRGGNGQRPLKALAPMKPRPERVTVLTEPSLTRPDAAILAESPQPFAITTSSSHTTFPDQPDDSRGRITFNGLLSTVTSTEAEMTRNQIQSGFGLEFLPGSADSCVTLFDLTSLDNDVLDAINSSILTIPLGHNPQDKQTSQINLQSTFNEQSTSNNILPNPLLQSSISNPLVLPDLYANTLQLTRTNTLAACFKNAIHLGFDLDRITDPKYMSPFFNPHMSQTDDYDAMTDLSNPPHLRPTLPQILFPHHASIDLLPFPELRTRAIQLASSTNSGFNLMELKKDAYHRDGIVCWSGPPWDPRSWEAEPWFLSKWKLVVGGEAGELWKSSKWWRRSRGQYE